MVPFVPLIVLTGSAIVTSREADKALVDAALQVMQPATATSPIVDSVYRQINMLYAPFH